MNKNRGFTLIELLAVIVILAIIALIAVPVVMNIIAKARKSAAADSAYSILGAAELYYADQLLENPTKTFSTIIFDYSLTDDALPVLAGNKLDIKGTKPTAGKFTIEADGDVVFTSPLIINGYSCEYKLGSTSEIECKE